MFIKSLALAGLLSLAATAAMADPRVATLATPVAQPVSFVAGGADWTCQGNTCTASLVSDESQSSFGCRALTRQVGAVVAYGDFDAKRLAKCNTGFNAPAQTAQAGSTTTTSH